MSLRLFLAQSRRPFHPFLFASGLVTSCAHREKRTVSDTSICGRSGRDCTFIGGRTVQSWNRNIVQAKIDAQLTAMVNQMVHDHAPKNACAWHAEKALPVVEKRPGCHELLIGGFREGCASFSRALVKSLNGKSRPSLRVRCSLQKLLT